MKCPHCNTELEIVLVSNSKGEDVEILEEPPYSESMEESADDVGKEKKE